MKMQFDSSNIPVTSFGPGRIQQLPERIAQLGKKAIFLTGKKSFTDTPHWTTLKDKCDAMGISYLHATIPEEPSPDMIDEITSKIQGWNPEVVIAIGGGSVIDAGKAVSAMLCEPGSIIDYLEGVGTKMPSGKKIPFIAVPTTSGTGAEATKNAVISEVGENGYKRSLRHNNYVPDVAIIDAELITACPKAVTAQSGMDAFTQLLESYLSTQANHFTDALAVDGIRHIRDGLLDAFHDGTNLKARNDMAYAAYLSGITLANAGLGTVHGFASSIGGYYDIPHGLICARMMGPVNLITVRKLRKSPETQYALYKYARIGKLFSADKNKTDEYYTDLLLTIIQEWTEILGIKRLGDCGVLKNNFARIVKQTGNKYNPVALHPDELTEALELAF